jgi:thymidylate kinase
MITFNPKLIAICGVDGVGKSTLIDMLENDLGQQDILFTRKNIHKNSDLIKQFHGVLRKEQQDWFASSFSRANAFACAFDFLAHYHEIIKPIISDGRVAICDRYKPCYLAYGFVVSSVYEDICDLLMNIPEAEYIFYIDAHIDLIMKRLASKEPDEIHNKSLLIAYANAYEQILESQSNVVRIYNNEDIRDVYQKFKKEITNVLRG